MERTVSFRWLPRAPEAAGAAGDFISLRLPPFFAWFACAVVVLLVLFVVWMSFVAGVRPNRTLHSELRQWVRWLSPGAGYTQHRNSWSRDRCGRFVFWSSIG